MRPRFLDGRDVPPASAKADLRSWRLCWQIRGREVVTVSDRYYAMLDRTGGQGSAPKRPGAQWSSVKGKGCQQFGVPGPILQPERD